MDFKKGDIVVVKEDPAKKSYKDFKYKIVDYSEQSNEYRLVPYNDRGATTVESPRYAKKEQLEKV